jgi:hypothetical protein
MRTILGCDAGLTRAKWVWIDKLETQIPPVRMDRKVWCQRFVEAWTLILPDTLDGFALLLAQRAFDLEGAWISPEASAREHIELLQRRTYVQGDSDTR